MRLRMALACLLLALTACEESPTGRKQVTLVPDQQMAQIGSRTFDELLRNQAVVEDQRVLDYVGCITRALVNALPEPHGEPGPVAYYGGGRGRAAAGVPLHASIPQESPR